MKNRLLSMCLFSLAALSVQAIPAKKGIWRTFSLQNGNSLNVELCGDEFLSFWQDADGNRYVEKDQKLVPADMKALQNSAVQFRKQAGTYVSDVRKAPSKSKKTNFTGNKRCIILLVQFNDKKFSMDDPKAFYTRVANEKGFNEGNFRGSVSDYFSAQSLGKLNITFDVEGPYTLGNYAEYGKDQTTSDGQRYDVNAQGMISTACAMASASGVDFSPYDWDGDGLVDEVYVIYAGEGQATGGPSDTIWPHKSNLSTPTKFGNTSVYVYACSNEIMDSKGNVAGIGAICHEFSHCLGYPDMYDVYYQGNYGMGHWDLMCSGSYNGNAFLPCGYTAYERMVAGWIEPIELDDDVEVTGMKSISDGGDAYIFYNPGNSNEYYLIENRQQEGWDAGLAASGIMVNHIDYSPLAWSYNVPNSTLAGVNDHERVTFIPADGNRSNSSESGDPWPYGNRKNLTNSTTPYCLTYNPNTNGLYKMNIGITNMAIADDNSASFRFANYNKGNTPDGKLFAETFNRCAGKGGNDEAGFIPPKLSQTFANGEFVADVAGWTGTYLRGASMCARIGNTSATQATVTSPEITLDGEATLKFKAAPYGSDGTALKLSVDNGELSQSDFDMVYNQWTDFSTTVTGHGKLKLTFQGTRRWFLDEVTVDNSSTGIIGVGAGNSVVPAVTRIYSLDGRYMGNDFSKLGKGLYIVNGKKVVK